MDIEVNKAKRKQYFQDIEIEDFMDVVINQMNAFRMKGHNLVQDMDDLVNDYLAVCKKYPIK
tara:strand:- start:415 stop:600 length:186 start_codon:yes stop_codon:yes gene_type:complete